MTCACQPDPVVFGHHCRHQPPPPATALRQALDDHTENLRQLRFTIYELAAVLGLC